MQLLKVNILRSRSGHLLITKTSPAERTAMPQTQNIWVP